jgi:hypothetical protein
MTDAMGNNISKGSSNSRDISSSNDTRNTSIAINFANQEASCIVFLNKLNYERKNLNCQFWKV